MRWWLIAAILLLLGRVAIQRERPTLDPVAAPVPGVTDRPSDDDAVAAVRRFAREASTRMPQATLTLGTCARSTLAAGQECAATIVPRPGARPQRRLLGFARFGGRWERIY